MPGATLGEELDDGTRKLTITVRLGSMKFVYGGTVRISERDDAQRRAVLVGAARESRGQGSANATITMTVSSAGDAASRVDSVAQIDLTGRAGKAPAAAAPEPVQEIRAGSLFWSLLWERLRRLWRRRR